MAELTERARVQTCPRLQSLLHEVTASVWPAPLLLSTAHLYALSLVIDLVRAGTIGERAAAI